MKRLSLGMLLMKKSVVVRVLVPVNVPVDVLVIAHMVVLTVAMDRRNSSYEEMLYTPIF